MAKYMIQASYTQSGVKGLLKEGGANRRDVIAALIAGLGGSLEGFYFGFGQADVYVIAELPDNATAAAVSLTVAAAGAVTANTVVLLTPEDIDAARKISVDYRPPGA